MISFREYLERERDRAKKQCQLHAKHHNDVSALKSAFPGEDLDKARKVIHNNWRGRSKRHSMRKFIHSKQDKWGELWSKFRAETDNDKRG